jgi:bacteriophage N4 adsorption protein B
MNWQEAIVSLYFLMWYFLVLLSVLFICSGLDDLFIDFSYWVRAIRRYFKTRHYPPLTYQKLADKPEQLIAILVPCWHEAGVIGTMLEHNVYSIDYQNYCIFVGAYPNDPATIEEVQRVALKHKKIQLVVNQCEGPTNKAENLNQIYLGMCAYEKTYAVKFDMIVFHDSEDIIHPLSLKLYNYLIPRKDMIQIPVFPLRVSYHKFTHWLYADEFSENHTKNIVVREAIGAHVPSAGVGTALSRHAIELIRQERVHGPFSTDTLTEDYRTSLAIRLLNLKQIFVTQAIFKMQWEPRGWFRKGYVQRVRKEYIATRALFPMEYKKSVRQKARWIIGIVFQEWEHNPWPEQWRVRYSVSHDRKGFVSHFINGFSYFVFLFWVIYTWCTQSNPNYPSLREQFNLHPWVWWLIGAVTFIMFERMLQRMIAVKRIYSWVPALLSIPRTFYGNLLNLNAVLRAYSIFFAKQVTQTTAPAAPIWDKTDHTFPGSHILMPYRRRLGDLLIEAKKITPEQLEQAMIEQQKSGNRIGNILCKMGFLTPTELITWLGRQYDLQCFPKSILDVALEQYEPAVPKRVLRWFKTYEIKLLFVDLERCIMKLGIEDPTNELLIEKVINYIAPFEAQFMLIDPYR